MKPLAIIVNEPYASIYCDELIYDLLEKGIQVKVVHSFSEIINKINRPFLLYRHGDIRIPDPKSVAQFHADNDFAYIAAGDGEIVSVDPRQCVINEKGVVLGGSSFILNEQSLFRHHDTDIPLTVFYSYQRSKFLELSLKSFAYSLGDDFKNQKIAIVLNGHREYPETLTVAKSFADSHKMADPGFIHVLLPEENAGVTAVNLAIQHYSDDRSIKTVLVHEDDMLLPSTVAKLYPEWTRKFSYWTKDFDVVGWGTSFHCRPLLDYLPVYVKEAKALLSRFDPEQSEHPQTKYLWVPSYIEKLALGAQCICFKVDYYKKCARLKEKDRSCVDSDLLLAARKYLVPRIPGYHIGWDQEVYGYNSHYIPGKWKEPPQQNQLHNITLDRKENYNLSSIIN